jgi:hypothetical protein
MPSPYSETKKPGLLSHRVNRSRAAPHQSPKTAGQPRFSVQLQIFMRQWVGIPVPQSLALAICWAKCRFLPLSTPFADKCHMGDKILEEAFRRGTRNSICSQADITGLNTSTPV